MAGLLDFAARFGAEEHCIEHLAGLRWPRWFCVLRLRRAGGLATEGATAGLRCGVCHRQESVTAGTVFHRTRTGLAKWFLAAYLMGRDKRGVSAKFLQRELGVAYQTARTMAHKLRHGLSEDPARPLRGFLEPIFRSQPVLIARLAEIEAARISSNRDISRLYRGRARRDRRGRLRRLPAARDPRLLRPAGALAGTTTCQGGPP
jgi:hypothetical protein